jgi:quercetin dioxygenase-like cupin family protein
MNWIKPVLSIVTRCLSSGFAIAIVMGFALFGLSFNASVLAIPQSSTQRSPIVVQTGKGESVGIPGEIFTFIARNKDTDGAYATWELLVSPNSGPPLHKHDGIEESFEVLEGEITAEVNGQTYFAPAGSYINIPRGAAHTWKNTGTTMTKIRTLVVPGGMDDYFVAVGRPMQSKSTPIAEFRPGEGKRMAELGTKYGIEYLNPTVSLKPSH